MFWFLSFINHHLQAGGAPETELQSGRGAAEGEDGPDEAGAEGDVAPLSSGLQDVGAVRQLRQVKSQSGKYFYSFLMFYILLVRRKFSIFEGAAMFCDRIVMKLFVSFKKDLYLHFSILVSGFYL